MSHKIRLQRLSNFNLLVQFRSYEEKKCCEYGLWLLVVYSDTLGYYAKEEVTVVKSFIVTKRIEIRIPGARVINIFKVVINTAAL